MHPKDPERSRESFSCSRLRSRLSLQRVLGLASLDGVLNPAHVSGKHIVHNVFHVNKSGIVVLESKAGVSSLGRAAPLVPDDCLSLTSCLSADDMPYWVVSAMRCLASCKFDAAVFPVSLIVGPCKSHDLSLRA